MTARVWQTTANKDLNDAFFGKDYKLTRSFWAAIFETLKNRRTLRRLLRANPSVGGTLLEIGVGTGSLLTAARARGYTPSGCDLSPVICSKVERSTGISVHCGSIESFPNGSMFDVVVMNHVLEHVSEPVVLLKAVRKHLRPGGMIHLAVPNVGSWEAQLSGWNSYEPYHLLYFTPLTLRSAVEAAGFQIQRLATHESFSGWFLAILRTFLLKARMANAAESCGCYRRPHSAPEHVYRLAMVAWGIVTLPLRRLQESLGRGDEVILIARHAIHD